MKRIFLLLLLLTLSPLAYAQQAPASIARQLYSFSPMAQIYLKHLGLVDKNSNGVIDKDAGEGYEAFTAKYGNADVGFYANGITQNAKNGKLEEPEIINHYYINIRFQPNFQQETAAIESEVKAYVYANKIPLVWLDDQQGTVMKAVNRILGEGWQDKKVTLDEAEKRFTSVMDALRIYGLPSAPIASGLGYRTLPDLVRTREGYCFEIAQFYFWLFSESKIRSINTGAVLTEKLSHGVIKLTDNNRIIDYSGAGNGIPSDQWHIYNPVQGISDYYIVQAGIGKTDNMLRYYEQAVVYNKYDITNIGILMEYYAKSNNPNYGEIIALGEFILLNIDFQRVMTSDYKDIKIVRNNFKAMLFMLVRSYRETENRLAFDYIVRLLNQYFRNEPNVRELIDYYRF